MYTWIEHYKEVGAGQLWPGVRAELQVAIAIAPLIFADNDAETHPTAYCVDSSKPGFAALSSRPPREELVEGMRYAEQRGWHVRLRPEEEEETAWPQEPPLDLLSDSGSSQGDEEEDEDDQSQPSPRKSPKEPSSTETDSDSIDEEQDPKERAKRVWTEWERKAQQIPGALVLGAEASSIADVFRQDLPAAIYGLEGHRGEDPPLRDPAVQTRLLDEI